MPCELSEEEITSLADSLFSINEITTGRSSGFGSDMFNVGLGASDDSGMGAVVVVAELGWSVSIRLSSAIVQDDISKTMKIINATEREIFFIYDTNAFGKKSTVDMSFA